MSDFRNLTNSRSTLNFDPRDAFPEDHNRMRAWCVGAQARLGQQAQRIKALEAALETERTELRRLQFIAGPAGRPGW